MESFFYRQRLVVCYKMLLNEENLEILASLFYQYKRKERKPKLVKLSRFFFENKTTFISKFTVITLSCSLLFVHNRTFVVCITSSYKQCASDFKIQVDIHLSNLKHQNCIIFEIKRKNVKCCLQQDRMSKVSFKLNVAIDK